MALSDAQIAKLLDYLDLLVGWNARIGLTALREPDEILRIHFVDALCVLRASIPPGATLLDVGTGAGLPGIPLQIARPDLVVTLVESNRRKVAFLERVASELNLDLRIELARAESAGQQRGMREAFEIATTRAVARLAVACELTLPFVRVGGKGIFLKGPRLTAELAAGSRAATALGGGALQIVEAEVPDGRRRLVVIVPKNGPTPASFPRRPGIPRRSPLG